MFYGHGQLILNDELLSAADGMAVLWKPRAPDCDSLLGDHHKPNTVLFSITDTSTQRGLPGHLAQVTWLLATEFFFGVVPTQSWQHIMFSRIWVEAIFSSVEYAVFRTPKRQSGIAFPSL